MFWMEFQIHLLEFQDVRILSAWNADSIMIPWNWLDSKLMLNLPESHSYAHASDSCRILSMGFKKFEI